MPVYANFSSVPAEIHSALRREILLLCDNSYRMLDFTRNLLPCYPKPEYRTFGDVDRQILLLTGTFTDIFPGFRLSPAAFRRSTVPLRSFPTRKMLSILSHVRTECAVYAHP